MKIGIDIGGTQIRIGLIEQNKIIKFNSIKTNVQDFYINLQNIEKIILSYNVKIESIGISCPGPLDISKGIILEAPNLVKWRNINIIQEFKKVFKIDNIKINNDANVAALGQFICRKNLHSLLYFTISTGIGGGFVNEGQIYNGFSQTACEIANALPDINSEDIAKSGIEFIASGVNIPLQLQKRSVKVKETKEAFDIFYKKENKIVNDYFQFLKEQYIKLFATAIYFLNPEVIVLGGSVALNNQEFFNDIFKKVLLVTNDIKYKTIFEYAIDLDNNTLIATTQI